MANGLPLTSDGLASLIVDALVDAGLLDRARFEEAVAVATTEIDVRKAMGDYAGPTVDAPRPAAKHRDRAG